MTEPSRFSAFATVAFGTGIVVAWGIYHQHTSREIGPLGYWIGGFVLVTGIWNIYDVVRRESIIRTWRTAHDIQPNKPWTWLREWTGLPGIPQNYELPSVVARGMLIVFFIIGLGLLFVSPGFAILWCSIIGFLWSRSMAASRLMKRYGRAQLVLGAVPVPLGGELAGMITVPHGFQPAGAGKVALSCWNRSLVVQRRRKGRSWRVHSELLGETTARVVELSEWNRRGEAREIVVSLPVRGGRASTGTLLQVDEPTVEWTVGLEVPCSDGQYYRAEFHVPVFPVAGVTMVHVQKSAAELEREAVDASHPTSVPSMIPSPGMTAPPITPAVLTEALVQVVEGETFAPVTQDIPDVFRAADITSLAISESVGGYALVIGPGAAKTAARLQWGGIGCASIIAVFTAVFGGMFFLIPYVGWVLGSGVLVIAAVVAWSTFVGMREDRGGGECLWVEPGFICVERDGRPVRRVEVAGVDRYELQWRGGSGSTQFIGLDVATEPASGGIKRARSRLVFAVVGWKTAGAIATWLQERTGGPVRPVVRVEQGVQSLETIRHCWRKWRGDS